MHLSHSLFSIHWSRSLNHQTEPQTVLERLTRSTFFLHALATPLSSVLILIDLCSEQLQTLEGTEETRHLLSQARLNTQYLQQILRTSYQQTFSRRERFRLKSALQEVITRLHQPHDGRYIYATLAIPDQLTLPGQAFFLQEAVSCLITNAFNAYGPKRKKTVVVACYHQSTSVILQVSDVGGGMDWVSTQLLLHHHLKPPQHLHGHGLHFVKDVSDKLYRGKVHVYSIKDTGTIVTWIIPLSARFSLS